MNLHKEAMAIAKEAVAAHAKYGQDVSEYIHDSCDFHEVAIYYHKAIQFCAEQDTSAGEEWLDGIGGICQPGDSFGAIACRIAYATLYCAAQDALQELEEEGESDAYS
jgi:hypothetical protein